MYRFFGLFLIFLFLLAGCNSGGGSGGGNNNNAVLAANADLSDLTLSAGPLDQVFQANQTSYTATVGFLIATTTVTPTTDDPDATVTVNGQAVISATASDSIMLDEGLNTIKVIVTAEDGITTRTYTLDVTRQTAADFAQQAYLKASNIDAGDQFGFSVALAGNTLAVGAVGEGSSTVLDQDNNTVPGAGAVYVFTRNNGVWSQQAYLKASNIDAGDQFGFSLALADNTLAVGAVGEGSSTVLDQDNNTVPGAGAVYVFTRNNGDWTQQEYLKASNIDAGDQFGFSIALADDTLAVGAVGEGSSTVLDQDNNTVPGAGAVYVFTRNNGDWTQQAYLKASNIDAGDLFGLVALAGDTLAVGAVGEGSSTILNQDNNTAPGAGAVYVFTRNNGDWTQQVYVKASNVDAGDQFGVVALSGDTLAVGAVGEGSSTVLDQDNNTVPDAGAVYVFQ